MLTNEFSCRRRSRVQRVYPNMLIFRSISMAFYEVCVSNQNELWPTEGCSWRNYMARARSHKSYVWNYGCINEARCSVQGHETAKTLFFLLFASKVICYFPGCGGSGSITGSNFIEKVNEPCFTGESKRREEDAWKSC